MRLPASPAGIRAVLAILAVGWLGIVGGCQKDGSSPAAGQDGAGPLISDTGYVLMLTGNWIGQLEPCGCSARQLGGIDRRSHVLRAVDARARLLLDNGPLIERDDRQNQLKLEAFLSSMRLLGYDGVTLTGRELELVGKELALAGESRPRIIATNLSELGRQAYQAVRYLERTLQRGQGKLDCLVMAVSDPVRPGLDSPESGPQWLDPVSAVIQVLLDKKIAPVQPSTDRLIILLVSDANEERAEKLGQIRALDLIVKVGYADEPDLARPAGRYPAVVTSGRLGKYVCGFQLPVDQPAQMDAARFFSIPIEENYPRDPKIVRIIDNYQLQLQVEDLVRDEDILPRMALPEGLSFVGNDTCRSCHSSIHQNWSGFAHAHAMETLQRVNRQFDPECVNCHAVGLKYLSGYRSLQTTPEMAGVGCESCHGPGSKHIEDRGAPFQMIFTACEDCHNHETSPVFEAQREEYFKKISHWTEPRRYWK
ncbi:MAG: cytochrome c family protein [Sedimentisphaerales bacterium]|nr:cytochrome c family protein [Sedimentisphaerales bacterium]